MKLRSTGGAQDLTLRAIGAVPVRMAAPDAYESLSRGTMDGLLFPLGERGHLRRRQTGQTCDRRPRLRQLHRLLFHQRSGLEETAPEMQKAMIEAANEIIPSACQYIQKADESTQKTLEAAGVRFEMLKPESMPNSRT